MLASLKEDPIAASSPRSWLIMRHGGVPAARYAAMLAAFNDLDLTAPVGHTNTAGGASLSRHLHLMCPPPLPSGFSLPLHSGLPSSEWRETARRCLQNALHPVALQYDRLNTTLTTSDWPLTALIHPTSTPKGPLRSTFAMPSGLSSHGAAWVTLCFQSCIAEKRFEVGMRPDAVLAAWMRVSGVGKCVCYDHVLFEQSQASSAVPDAIAVPAAICLLGVVLRTCGNGGAGQLIEEMVHASEEEKGMVRKSVSRA